MSPTPPAPCVAVAYSGGRDSTALLHATLAVAGGLGVQVVALHVHHGLNARADDWLAHAEQQCARWAGQGKALSFASRRLSGRPARGESVEAWARRERYAALREMALAHGSRVVLLAHHRQDQAETFLLQALRSAGVAGLAAMPPTVEREGVTWARPWLHCDAGRIAAYARRHRLRHVEDDSNADPRFARNRLRLAVWPALMREFPHAEAALAAAAAWAQEAHECTHALAAIDLSRVASKRGLDIAAWMQLAPARRSNALRTWLRNEIGRAPEAALTQRLLIELPAASAPAQWTAARLTLRRYRGWLSCLPAAAPIGAPERVETLAVARAGTYALAGWGGRLRILGVRKNGVARSSLAQLRLAERSGGEDFQLAPGRPARSLKKQFQARAVPAWQRTGPLVYAGERLLFVPGLGVDARALAADGEAQIAFEWLNDAR
ncbi:MAG: tRNA lysidine(34) synthetase TilS [Ideonella sp.]|nr:tRNA lysidine(34) synthetase TilS [Ideonella sp.]